MHENTQHQDPVTRQVYWWHRWVSDPAEVVRRFVNKFRAWRPLQQRARDGTAPNNKEVK